MKFLSVNLSFVILFLQAFLMIADDIRKLAVHHDYRSVIRTYFSCLEYISLAPIMEGFVILKKNPKS